MRKTWTKRYVHTRSGRPLSHNAALRLLGCQRDPEVWQKVLQLRTLVLQPREDIESWIRYADLCRKASRLQASQNIMNILFKEDSETDAVSNSTRIVRCPFCIDLKRPATLSGIGLCSFEALVGVG